MTTTEGSGTTAVLALMVNAKGTPVGSGTKRVGRCGLVRKILRRQCGVELDDAAPRGGGLQSERVIEAILADRPDGESAWKSHRKFPDATPVGQAEESALKSVDLLRRRPSAGRRSSPGVRPELLLGSEIGK